MTVVEVNVPAATSRVTSYLKDGGSNVSVNSSYQVIDTVWQGCNESNVADAILFAKKIISDPELTNELVDIYFAKTKASPGITSTTTLNSLRNDF